MRLQTNNKSARVGNVEVHSLSRVTELDAGRTVAPNQHQKRDDGTTNICFSHESLQDIEKQLAIVVPCMNEDNSILEGVLHGIPHNCLIVLVSNSDETKFKSERTLLTEFCTDTQREGIVVHQQDSGVADAFLDAGMPDIVNMTKEQERTGAEHISNGKGEAMMIGIALSKLAGKQFVGFIDADNFVPGAVQEYCNVFAAGLHHALQSQIEESGEEPYAMVRIKWKSKPKIVDGKLVAQEAGRCSRVVNTWMNRLLETITDESIDEDFIKTANAGEHAMSIDLALELNFATGYAVEPFQLINAFERSGPPTPDRVLPKSISQKPLSRKLHILQVETLNPHIHDFGKGEEHIQRMQTQGLTTIYHSSLASQKLKDELLEYMDQELPMSLGENGRPYQARLYSPMEELDWDGFKATLNLHAYTLRKIGP